MKEPKWIYIFGNYYSGFVGYTANKEMAKRIKKYRYDLDCHKIKYNKDLVDHLSVNDKMFEICENSFMSAIEEEYYGNSFAQLKIDVSCYINHISEWYKYIKWSDEEKEIIDVFITFLNDYVDYLRLAESDDDLSEDDIFDNEKAIKYFIKHVLIGDNK